MQFSYSPINRNHVMDKAINTIPSYTGLLTYLYDRPVDDVKEEVRRLPAKVLNDLHAQELISYDLNADDRVESLMILSTLYVAGLMLDEMVATREWRNRFGEEDDPVLAD